MAMRNAPEPKEVAKVILESIEASVVSARQGANNNISLDILLVKMQNCMQMQKGK
jgi:hypothetical protein